MRPSRCLLIRSSPVRLLLTSSLSSTPLASSPSLGVPDDNFDMACPFGGYKESGWGSDKGEYALDNYTITKCVMLPVDTKA